MMRRPDLTVVIVLAILIGVFPFRVAAQITTQTALPVSTGQGILRIQLKSPGASGSNGREVNNLVVPMVLIYGLNHRLAAFGVVPVVSRNFDMNTPAGKIERDLSGLADTRLWLRYTIYQHNGKGMLTRLAPLAGVELPTGSTTGSDHMGRLPRLLQLGSGGWDPFVGFVFTHQRFAWQVDISAVYQANSEYKSFQFGDISRLDIASKIRLLPRTLGSGLPRFLYANLETNLIDLARNRTGNQTDADSGGFIWFVAPGLQLVSRRVVFETALQIPLVTDMNGTALEPDTAFILSTRVNF